MGEQSATIFGNVIAALFPSAVAVNLGVTGNTSAQLLARFDADVPADAAYVIFNEPGVNDATGVTGATTLAQNVDLLVAKIRALDAVPVYTGVVLYTPGARVSAINSDRMKAAAGQWQTKGPGVTLSDVYAAILPTTKTASTPSRSATARRSEPPASTTPPSVTGRSTTSEPRKGRRQSGPTPSGRPPPATRTPASAPTPTRT